MKKKTWTKKASEPTGSDDRNLVDLRLYVTDGLPCCLTAYENLCKICDEYAGGKYRITVIDLLKNPVIAREDDITAIPTLIRILLTEGSRKIIGMLTDTEKVLDGIDLPKKSIYLDQGTIRNRTTAH